MLAIDAVGEANSDGLAKQLIDVLLGEQDSVPKDPSTCSGCTWPGRCTGSRRRRLLSSLRRSRRLDRTGTRTTCLLGMYQELRNHKIRLPMVK